MGEECIHAKLCHLLLSVIIIYVRNEYLASHVSNATTVIQRHLCRCLSVDVQLGKHRLFENVKKKNHCMILWMIRNTKLSLLQLLWWLICRMPSRSIISNTFTILSVLILCLPWTILLTIWFWHCSFMWKVFLSGFHHREKSDHF